MIADLADRFAISFKVTRGLLLERDSPASSSFHVPSDNDIETMIDQLLHALVSSKNQAADDVLVEALRLGDAQEKRPVLLTLIAQNRSRTLRRHRSIRFTPRIPTG